MNTTCLTMSTFTMWILTLALLALASASGSRLPHPPNLVTRLAPLTVLQGRAEYLHTGVFQVVKVEPDHDCRVEVVDKYREPMSQRVGIVNKQVFRCDYPPYSVKYTHNGSPLLTTDQIRLRVFYFTEDKTLVETVVIPIKVVEAPYEVFLKDPQRTLEVKEFYGLSNPLDATILRFRYNYYNGASCQVSYSNSGDDLPSVGRFLTGEESDPVEQTFHSDCRDFLFLGLRYRHVKPPTTDTDYIPLQVEVNDPMQADEPILEQLYLPVVINDAFPNTPPKASFMASYTLDVDEFIMKILDPESMSAEDAETLKSNLVFNISMPPAPGDGFFIHVDDQTKPITSFLQGDLINHNIGYIPPSTTQASDQYIQVQFVAYDSGFMPSEPILLDIAIEPSSTSAPRVAANMGLTVIEGQSRPVTTDIFRVVDSDNLNSVRIEVKSGLRHGKLLVKGVQSTVFTVADIENGEVIYYHDDSDTLADRIALKIGDGTDVIRAQIPITVLPKDDSAPYLVNNREMSVREGDFVMISDDVLSARDRDSASDDVTFLIRTPPKYGEIVKRFRSLTKGVMVSKFTQLDIQRGYVFYRHIGGDNMADSFEFRLLDKNDPPNRSRKFRADITVIAVNDRPPRQVTGSSRQVTVRETEIVPILKGTLQYEDSESDPDDIVYTVTSQPYLLTTTITVDAGRVISTENLTALVKSSSIPPIRTFTQSQINQRKVAYMPPVDDVGPVRRHAQFIYTVEDSAGNKIMDQAFDITIIPVNNQGPIMVVRHVSVLEGGSVTITTNEISGYDPDTDQSDLWFIIENTPAHGQLMQAEVAMQAGDRFRLEDISNRRVRYVHDGSDEASDVFTISITDDVNKLSKVVPVKVQLLDDQVPRTDTDLQNSLQLLEGGDVMITSNNLAGKDEEVEDEDLVFMVWKSPEYGTIQLDEIEVKDFSQAELKQDKVKYVHDSREIGPEPKEDFVLFNVYDSSNPRAEEPDLLELHFTIVPIDNAVPELLLGEYMVVKEGDKAAILPEILYAHDLDTLDKDLMFYLSKLPRWGFIENVKPDPVTKMSGAGVSVHNFHLTDIKAGTVHYVQANHSHVEPIQDSFDVYVMDGKLKSAPTTVQINILPQNDELPQLVLEDVVVDEGGETMVDPHLMEASDLDSPQEKLILSMEEPPRHGKLALLKEELGNTAEMPMRDVSLSDMSRKMHLKYKHDGSEHYEDRFTLKLTDGKHSSRKTSKVKVMPVNDEKPYILRNKGLAVKYGHHALVSPVVLESKDTDNAVVDLTYIIITPPNQGLLQIQNVRSDKDDGSDIRQLELWRELVAGDNFTQHDVDSNHVRYVHTGSPGPEHAEQDSFTFQLTDGVNSLPHQTLTVEIFQSGIADLAVLNRGLNVKEGDSKVITTDELSASDNANKPEDIVFVVTRQPEKGQLEMITDKMVAISRFTQLDLAAEKLVYSHTTKQDAKADYFEFVVINSQNQSRSGLFHVHIQPLDEVPPSLEKNVPLTVVQGGLKHLTGDNLMLSDPDTAATNLTYIVVESPRHGQLILGTQPLQNNKFTQIDVDSDLLAYKSNKSDYTAHFDYFLFTITDGHNEGYLQNGSVINKPAFFNILIQPLAKEPPQLLIMKSPNTLEFLGNEKYGYMLTDRHLKAVHGGSDSQDISYIISQKPQHGYLHHLGTKRMIRKRFTQKDIDDGNVVFVLEENIRATNDSFVFRVQNAHRNALEPKRFIFAWSVIEFKRPQYIVCENAGTVTVSVERYGALNDTSFVDIRAKEMSAKEADDYVPSAVTQLQFEPGMGLKTWELQIVKDRLEEPNEKFKVLLRHPVNAMIGWQDKTIIQLINLDRQGLCAEYIGMLTADVNSVEEEEVEPESSLHSKQEVITNHHVLSEMRNVFDLDEHDNFNEKSDEEGDHPFDIFKHGLEHLKKDEVDQSMTSREHPLKGYREEKKGRKGRRYKGAGREVPPTTTVTTPIPSTTVAPQLCNEDTRDLLYFDLTSSNMYRCDGLVWKKVGWGSNYLHTAMLRDSSSSNKERQQQQQQEPASREGDKSRRFRPSDLGLGQTARQTCPDDWTEYEDSCYHVMGGKETWDGAESKCAELESHLVNVADVKTAEWLWGLVGQKPFWIGMNDNQVDGQWVYTNGASARYFNWKTKFPRKRNSHIKNCVLVAKRAEWVNRPCNEKKAKYVCGRTLQKRKKRRQSRT